MKVLILAGGVGSRLSEETTTKPKPMVEIGGKPIIWHIMKIYSHYGFNEFIILCGYKGYMIKEYFANYYRHMADMTIDLANNVTQYHSNHAEPWKVTLLDTGENTMTGGRIKRAAPYIGNETFMLTYGDGVADIDILKLLAFHKSHKKSITMTSVQPEGRFGALNIDADNISKYDLEKSAMIYEAKIMPKDVLTIAVNTTVPEAAAPFNLGSSAGSGVISTGGVSITGAELQTYIVDKQGYIDYPVIGKLKVIGLTRVELQELIKSKIYPNYITEIPVVNVRFKNYKISVIGEVNNPGSYTLMNEQCTIFDALATAGDMTIYGRRDNVLLIREDATGKKNISRINLESASLLSNLDLYYLQQNDVIYVEPNRTKARSAGIGATESITISIVSTLVSVATLIFTILNNN